MPQIDPKSTIKKSVVLSEEKSKSLWDNLKEIFKVIKQEQESKKDIIEQLWNFYSALKEKDLTSLFKELKKVNNGKIFDLFPNFSEALCENVLFEVKNIIKNKNIDKGLKDIQSKKFDDIIKSPVYQFYMQLTSIEINEDGNRIFNVIFDSNKIANAIKNAQNEIASFLLRKLIRNTRYYSHWSSTIETFPAYSYNMDQNQIKELESDGFLKKQVEIICQENNEKGLYRNIEIKSNIGPKSIFFRGENIDKLFVFGKKGKTIKNLIKEDLRTIAKTFKNVWLFDQVIRNKLKNKVFVKLGIDKSIAKFEVNGKDWTETKDVFGEKITCNENNYSNCILQKKIFIEDMPKEVSFVENQKLIGFCNYVVNVYIAVRLLKWAEKVHENILRKSFGSNAIEKLKTALDACTAPNKGLQDLKKAINDFAVLKDNTKKLYNVTLLSDLNVCKYTNAVKGWEKKSKKKEEVKNLKKKVKNLEEENKNMKTTTSPGDLPKSLSLLKAKLLSLATSLKK